MSTRSNSTLLALLLPLVMLQPASADAPGDLSAFRWENRLIVLFTDDPDADSLSRHLREHTAAIDERHILWFLITPNKVETNFPHGLAQDFAVNVHDKYHLPSGPDTQVSLIGKDGGVKSRSGELDLEEIFLLIDGMPMRRSEMRQQALNN